MAKRRGFFAELNHQAQLAEKRRQQQVNAQVRANARVMRQYEQARRAAERAERAAAAASEAQRKVAEKEARAAYLEARQAEAASLNAQLSDTYAEIDGILASTLAVDDFVDLEALRVTKVDHPVFDGGKDATPLLGPRAPEYPLYPTYQEPAAPTGLGAAFGGKKKHAEAVAQARQAHEAATAAAQRTADGMYADYKRRVAEHQAAEHARAQRLAQRQEAYEQGCRQREREAAEGNAELDHLINDLAFDVPWAVQEYIGIVLSNSVYPEAFLIEHDFRFDLDSRELTLTARVPAPPSIPSVKEYKYVKAKDEISGTALALRDQKARYAGAVWQTAVRTLHEIFEADRAGRVHTISLTVDTTTIDPATGQPTVIPLVLVAADRETFSRFDLNQVVPSATLVHLGAAMSKSPYDLAPADTSRGVRERAK